MEGTKLVVVLTDCTTTTIIPSYYSVVSHQYTESKGAINKSCGQTHVDEPRGSAKRASVKVWVGWREGFIAGLLSTQQN